VRAENMAVVRCLGMESGTRKGSRGEILKVGFFGDVKILQTPSQTPRQPGAVRCATGMFSFVTTMTAGIPSQSLLQHGHLCGGTEGCLDMHIESSDVTVMQQFMHLACLQHPEKQLCY
jgi:hypothetical protein